MYIKDFILFGLLLAIIGLYIFACIKKNASIEKLTSVLLIPFCSFLCISILVNYLPDSFHIIIISVFALLFSSAAAFFFIFEKTDDNKAFIYRLIGIVSFIICILFWLNLYSTIFYIYKVPEWLNISAAIFYFVTAIAICVLCGKQKISYYAIFIVIYMTALSLNHFVFVALFLEHSIRTVPLAAGSLCTISFVILEYIKYTKKEYKISRKIEFVILAASQFLIAGSNILMIK